MRRRPWASVATGFILAGAVLRTLAVLTGGSLYVDDARLALSIGTRSFGGLTRPLDYSQVAPVGFVVAEKLMTVIGGVNEYALRAFPLLSGIAVLVLLWTVGRRVFGEEPAALTTSLAALSTIAIAYAGAVKQYSSDALVTLLIVWLVVQVLRASDDRAAWRRLAIGGTAAMWFSHPAVFVLAGAALALPASPAVRATPGWSRRVAATSATWIAMFAVLYLLYYQAHERDPFLLEFWEWTFLTPGAPDPGGRIWHAARAVLVPPVVWPVGRLLGSPLVLGLSTSVAFVAGIVAMFRAQGLSLVLLCFVPHAAVLAAAAMAKYPLEGRFMLFAAPLLLFVYGSALWWTARAVSPTRAARVMGVMLVLLSLWRYPAAVEQGLHPARGRETRKLVEVIHARAPGAPVYLLTPGERCGCDVWPFHTTDWRAPDPIRLRGFARAWSVRDLPAADSVMVGQRAELIGAGARVHYDRRGIAWSSEPDAEWARRESERIRRFANPVAWVWATEIVPENLVVALLHGIRERGGRLIFSQRVLGASVWEVEFGP